jgi:hypothetical protein
MRERYFRNMCLLPDTALSVDRVRVINPLGDASLRSERRFVPAGEGIKSLVKCRWQLVLQFQAVLYGVPLAFASRNLRSVIFPLAIA